MIYHGLQILALNLIQTQVPSPPGAASSPRLLSPSSLLTAPLLEKTFSLSGLFLCQRESGLFILCFVFQAEFVDSLQSPQSPCGSLQRCAGSCDPMPLAERSGYYFSQKTCVERRERDCTADWFTGPGPWICTSSLRSPPSQNLDCRRNAFLPYCVCPQGYIWSHAISMKSFHGT